MTDAFKGLKLTNTLTRTKDEFHPIDAANVRIYACGPTVYDFAHIGNARPVIVFDVLFRLLRHVYGEASVTYVRNITDVDDKINKRAFERWTRKRNATGVAGAGLNEEIRELTRVTADQFHKDIAALGVLPPTHEPRATEYVCDAAKPLDMVRVIEGLIAKGHAYAAEGHVLFHVPSMPAYGKLSRRSMDDMIAGARVEVAPYKKDPTDFVLWKPSDRDTEPGWDSPWSYGRPGWHIECSAMSGALLGDVFDIHAGGLDLIFPHHENEIAQTCCFTGKDVMANVWLHNGFLQVEGQKMSKSLGNFITINEVLRHFHGDVVRLNMLKTHYKKPIDWTAKGMRQSQNDMLKFAKFIEEEGANFEYESTKDVKIPNEFLDILYDDLDTSRAITYIHKLIGLNFVNNYEEKIKNNRSVYLCLEFLGFRGLLKPGAFSNSVAGYIEDRDDNRLSNLYHEILMYKNSVHNSLSDQESISFATIKSHNVEVSIDHRGDVVVNFGKKLDVEKINSLIVERLAARAAKNWAESDRIRDALVAMGIQLKDGKGADGQPVTTWEVKR